MKYFILVLLVVFFGLVGYGFYLNSDVPQSGDKWIGIGVLVLAFLIMPLFIASRYKKSKMGEFLKNQIEQHKNTEKQ